jgi:hypothetical protein
MNIFFKALLVGTAAGILDAISMVFMGASWQATLAAILHWLALGVIITYARLPFSAWFSGILLAVLTGIPMALLIARTGFDAFFFVTASVVLGGLMGLIVEKLILNQPRF